ncbi:MAG TPA: SRPBCC family protein [Steroidobacteraceae bacterium]|jgi:uncharacterized membrane protein
MATEPVLTATTEAPLSVQHSSTEDGAASAEDTEGEVIGRSVTVDRPRSELYGFCRDFAHLSRFMAGVRRVEVLDSQHARWVVGDADELAVWDTEVVETRADALIAWRTVSGTELLHRAQLEFRDAAGGRGTVVTATISYEQTGGRVGEMLARLFHRDPRTRAYQDLRRFKQLMETGEVATAAPPNAAPRA